MRNVLGRLGAVRHLAVCMASVLALASVPAQLFAQRAGGQGDADQKRYRQVIDDAVAEFALGHWEEAVVLFREAHALRPSAKTHRGLGQALFEARDYVRAIPHLQAALDAPDGPFNADERTRLERALDQAVRFVGRVTAIVEPPDAVVSVDGRAVDHEGGLQLNPGKHLIEVSADGYLPVQQAVDVEGSSTRTLRIALVRADAVQGEATSADVDAAPSSSPADGHVAEVPAPEAGARSSSAVPATLGWVSAGLAVVGIGAGVVMWRLRDDGPAADWKRNDCVAIPTLDDTCRTIQSQADGLETASLVSTIAGGVFAVTSVVMFVIAADDGEESRTSRAQLRCGAGLGALTCAGRF
jgi:hypothetical protein